MRQSETPSAKDINKKACDGPGQAYGYPPGCHQRVSPSGTRDGEACVRFPDGNGQSGYLPSGETSAGRRQRSERGSAWNAA